MITIIACRLILICLLSLQPSDTLLTEETSQDTIRCLREWPRQPEVDNKVYKIADELEEICNIYSEMEAIGWDIRAIQLVEKLKRIGKQALPAIEEIASDRNRNLMLRTIMTERLAFSLEPAVTEPLIELLIDKSEDPKMRSNVAELLGRILKDTTATNALIETMMDKSNPEKVRWAAINACGYLRYSRFIPLLFNLLKSNTNDDIRAAAALALASTGHIQSRANELIEILHNEEASLVSMCVIRALGTTMDERAIQPLLENILIKRSNCGPAIQAIANIGGPEATRVLFDIAFNDKEERVRVRAIKALIDIGDESIKTQIQDAIDGIKDSGYRKVVTDKFNKTF